MSFVVSGWCGHVEANSLHGLSGLTRRGAVCIGAVAGITALPALHLRAMEPIPIALPNFLAGNPAVAELASSITEIITANLKRSGLFVPTGRVH